MSFHPLFADEPPGGNDNKTDQKPDEKPAGGGAAQKPQDAMSMLMQFAPFILIALFFLVVMLPAQRRRKREEAARLAAMKPGAKVVLNSGIVGKIVTMKDGEDEIVIKSDDTKLRVLKASIATVVADDATAATPTPEVKS